MDTQQTPDYTNDGQQLAFAVVQYLSQHLLDPQPLRNIVKALAPASRDQVFRTVWNLQKAGWVRQSGANYELDVALIQLADRLRRATLDILSSYLGETRHGH